MITSKKKDMLYYTIYVSIAVVVCVGISFLAAEWIYDAMDYMETKQ